MQRSVMFLSRALAAVSAALLGASSYGATIGFEASEGWVIGGGAPAGSGCTLTTGSGSAPGVVAVSGGQALCLPLGALAQFDVSMPTTGVQHVAADLAFSSNPYTTGYYSDWAGLDFGGMQVLDSARGSGIVVNFDAAKANSVPTSYMNNEDLIMKVRLNGQLFTTPFASPASYRLDFAFDYTQNTTTFNLFNGGGTNPIANNTWIGTFPVTTVYISSRAWNPPDGASTNVDNLLVGLVPEPTLIGALAASSCGLLLRKRQKRA